MKVSSALLLFFISLFIIVMGSILTVSIIYLFFGIPLLVIGVLLLLLSVFSFFTGTLGGLFSLFSRKKKKKGRIVDLKEKNGVFQAK
ncbi:hypothetical protein GOV09_02070 [Candidatus Woesearchaeota archaeon]|nr:hypothetical protein [Candidatus Woesearchaeota archaeon]